MREHYGEDNLRYAMVITLTISLVGVFFLWMGVRSLKRDLETNATELAATGMQHLKRLITSSTIRCDFVGLARALGQIRCDAYRQRSDCP